MKTMAALLFLGLNFYVYNFFASGEVIPERRTFDAFPTSIEDWRCQRREHMDQDTLRNLGVTDYLLCNYVNSDRSSLVNVYVGYHATQVRREGGGSGENSIHPPEHCLPGSGWDIIDSRVVPLDLPGLPQKGEAKRFLIAKGQGRQLVYFWYQSRGRILASNFDVVFYRFWDRAVLQRTDGSLVRFTVPVQRGDVDAAADTFRRFASDFVPKLVEYVPN